MCMECKAALQDTFDSELKEELQGLYTSKVWSAVSEEVKSRLVDSLIKSLTASKLKV